MAVLGTPHTVAAQGSGGAGAGSSQPSGRCAPRILDELRGVVADAVEVRFLVDEPEHLGHLRAGEHVVDQVGGSLAGWPLLLPVSPCQVDRARLPPCRRRRHRRCDRGGHDPRLGTR